jgi:hypothetical protein
MKIRNPLKKQPINSGYRAGYLLQGDLITPSGFAATTNGEN